MSTTSGFVLGVITSATLTVLYGEQLSLRLQDAVQMHPRVAAQIEEVAAKSTIDDLREIMPTAQRIFSDIGDVKTVAAPAPEAPPTDSTKPAAATEAAEPAIAPQPSAAPAENLPTLEQRWEDYVRNSETLLPDGDFPWRACFQRAAASYNLPEALLLAVASGESNFDPAARSEADAVGLMQVQWPETSRHLGVRREADLYDPCTNVDAGARYISELAGRYEDNYHLVLAAYNYGPGRISEGEVPAGASWYSQYIYQHLQQVLGQKHIPTSELIERPAPRDAGHQVLMTFNQAYRARDYLAFMRAQLPELNLQQQSEALGFHDVVLLYQNETERRTALKSLNAAGIATLNSQSDRSLYL